MPPIPSIVRNSFFCYYDTPIFVYIQVAAVFYRTSPLSFYFCLHFFHIGKFIRKKALYNIKCYKALYSLLNPPCRLQPSYDPLLQVGGYPVSSFTLPSSSIAGRSAIY